MARTKVVGLAALIGFLACTAGSAVFMPSACCSSSCEPCPIVFCKSTPANSSQKVDVAAGPPPAAFRLFLLPAAPATMSIVPQIPALLSHEFRRPMRN